MTLAGFPHSGTPGSTPTCGSPRLFAACRALLRLSVPRHPPCALVRLTGYPLTSRLETWLYRPTVPSDLRVVLASSRRFATLLLLVPYPGFQCNQGRGVLAQWRSTCERFRRISSPKAEGPLTRGSRKEVIQPQVPLRLPCYDFAPVTELAFGGSLPCGLGHRLRALPTPMA